MVRRPYPVIVEARARRWTASRSGTVADMVGSAGSADSIRLPVRDVRARWRNPAGAFVDNRSWDGPCHHWRYLGSRGHTDPGTALAPPGGTGPRRLDAARSPLGGSVEAAALPCVGARRESARRG